MPLRPRHSFPARRLIAAWLLAGMACAQAQAPTGAPSGAREPVTLNFTDAEIEAVARTMASLLGRDIVVDPRVKGTISLSTERPVTPQAAYQHFLALLRLSGFTVVDANGLLKVVPEADAKLQGGPVSVGAAPAGNQLATQIFRLQFESANNLVPVLRPLISPNNTVNVSPGTNALVITDYADNLQRIGRIIAALDMSNMADVEVLPLQHTLAADLAPVVQRLADASGGPVGAPPGALGGTDAATRTTVIPEVRSNTLLVRAPNPARLNLVRSLVQRLDQPAATSPQGNIHVVYLKNADATRLAVTLRAALAGLGGTGGGAGPTAAAPGGLGGSAGASPATGAIQSAAAPSTGGQIQADPATNALVITAPEPQYRQLRAVIDRLDTRRAQVFVESLIAEVNADKAAEFGIQWQNVIGNTNNSHFGIAGTNFTIGGANIIGLNRGASAGTTLPSPGVNIGVIRQVNGAYLLSALARFLETNADGNVLSTPNLLTLDNEEARIVIGQNVPFVTGQYTNANAGGTGSVNPFQTIERRDVGLTLRVRPQISENGTVKMQIFQEVSSVQAGSVNSPSGLITNKRSIESTVLVDDGAIVVLGGLLQDEYAGNEQKVPGLGDVPLLGRLFKSETRSRKKTNLMVFLRPVVVRDAARGDELTLDRYELMRLKQQAAQPVPSAVVPVNGAPVLPPYPVPPAASAPPGAPAQPAAPTTAQPRAVPAPPLLQPRPLPPANDRE
ncbi:MAG: putative secretin, ral secretion pathway protein component of type secretion system [Pseudomonadota bacterium]|jgi:general secretion pathway protein D